MATDAIYGANQLVNKQAKVIFRIALGIRK